MHLCFQNTYSTTHKTNLLEEPMYFLLFFLALIDINSFSWLSVVRGTIGSCFSSAMIGTQLWDYWSCYIFSWDLVLLLLSITFSSFLAVIRTSLCGFAVISLRPVLQRERYLKQNKKQLNPFSTGSVLDLSLLRLMTYTLLLAANYDNCNLSNCCFIFSYWCEPKGNHN